MCTSKKIRGNNDKKHCSKCIESPLMFALLLFGSHCSLYWRYFYVFSPSSFSLFSQVQAQRARLFCKCVGVQGLLEKYAGSSVFCWVFFQLSYLFIYFTKRNAPHWDQYIKRPKGTNPNPCSQLFTIAYILKHTHSTPHSPPSRMACICCNYFFHPLCSGDEKYPLRTLKGI